MVLSYFESEYIVISFIFGFYVFGNKKLGYNNFLYFGSYLGNGYRSGMKRKWV